MDGDTSGSDEDQLDCLVKLLKSVGETEDMMRCDERQSEEAVNSRKKSNLADENGTEHRGL